MKLIHLGDPKELLLDTAKLFLKWAVGMAGGNVQVQQLGEQMVDLLLDTAVACRDQVVSEVEEVKLMSGFDRTVAALRVTLLWGIRKTRENVAE